MSATSPEVKAPAQPSRSSASEARFREDIGLRPGWITVATKEFADHVQSVRFYVLLVVLGIAALIPLYFAAELIRSAASTASGVPAIFLAMFTISPEGVDLVRVDAFVAIAAPLLGVAFAFDAVNGERHEGTLPRLLSQPIHRDDVINGKFAAGLAAIAVALAALVLVVSGFGMLRLGISPTLEEILRLVGWYFVTLLYVALWLSFGLLLSVVIRRAATSALVGFGIWLFVAVPIFGPFLVGLLGGFLAGGSTTIGEYLGTTETVQRILPGTLYQEASAAMLSPGVTSVSLSDFYSATALPSRGTLLTVDQSLILVWPHLVVLFALTIGCFALAYARFMRQEVRA
jgi:ABC-2 type transport system permease protein